MADFATSVAEFVAKVKGRGDAALRMIASDALSRVRELTPVRTGYLRANWQASFDGEVAPVDRESAGTTAAEVTGSVAGSVAAGRAGVVVGTAVGGPVGAVVGGVVGSVAGGVAGGEIGKSVLREGNPLAEARVGDTIFILNPVVYARMIEYGFSGKDSRGVSVNREGRGMVRQTVSEMPSIAQKAIDRISR
ncbi:hypothetical protein [Falsiroseomonas sp. CW058]|uniref:hypothetical protein n=1 Tax=Falsiroseomonas sp. CW058 TaxID=3388664 RepID=UPI003D316E6C